VTIPAQADNQPPALSAIPGQTVVRGDSFDPIPLDQHVSDPDDPDSLLVWSFSGNDELTVTIGADRIARVSSPGPSWVGTDTVRFIVTDPDGAADSTDVVFTVLDLARPPRLSQIPGQLIAEGGSFDPIALDDYVADDDDPDSLLTWEYRGAVHLSVAISSDRSAAITVTGFNWTGSETITFVVTDPSGLGDSVDVEFTVAAVSDTPSVADIPGETIDEGGAFTAIPLDNYVLDGDNADSEMVWTATGQSELTVDIDTDRSATIRAPDADWNGSETITFCVEDPDGLGRCDSAVFTVTPVNDAPVASNDSYTTGEGAVLAVTAGNGVLQNDTDIEQDPLTAELVTNTDAAKAP